MIGQLISSGEATKTKKKDQKDSNTKDSKAMEASEDLKIQVSVNPQKPLLLVFRNVPQNIMALVSKK